MRKNYAFRRAEKSLITLGSFLAFTIPLRQMAEFHTEKTSLHRIEATVVAFDIVVILFGLAVLAQHAHLTSHFFVVRSSGAAFSARSKIFAGVEAECTDMSHGAG